jgi:hypothetical protein
VSTLPDVLRAVKEIMHGEDPTTEILCGERYLAQEGASNRVLFLIVDGTWTGAPKIGAKMIGAVNDGCLVYIWGPETSDDFARYDAANVLRARFLNAMHRVAPGRITPGAVNRLRGTNELTYGEEYSLAFTYREDITAAKSIAMLPPVEGVPTSPPDPLQPPGTPASIITTVITVSPENP